MKSIIVFLRMAGVISLLLSAILAIVKVFLVARVFLFIALLCFVIIILLQMYRFFTRNYFSKGDMYDD